MLPTKSSFAAHIQISSIPQNLKPLQTPRILLIIWTSGLRYIETRNCQPVFLTNVINSNFPQEISLLLVAIFQHPQLMEFLYLLICCARASSRYQDFIHRGCLLTNKLLGQGYLLPRLKVAFKKFYGRHHDLVDRYERLMAADLFAVLHG